MKAPETIEEKANDSAEAQQARHIAALDALVAAKKARSRKHAQFLVNGGTLKLP